MSNLFQDPCLGATEVNPAENWRSYSSIWNNDARGTGHATSMLDSVQAWSAAHATAGEWVQMDLGKTTCLTGALTQRRAGSAQRVTSYKISYSTDGDSFTELNPVFSGNVANDDNIVKNRFQGVQARYVRLIVQTWEEHISMRAGLIAGLAGIF